MDITTSTGLAEAREVQTLVVYDPKSGTIVHRHYIVTFAGAKAPSGEAVETRAVEMARAQSGFKGRLVVLRADADTFDKPALYRVDSKSGKVLCEPLPTRRARRAKR